MNVKGVVTFTTALLMAAGVGTGVPSAAETVFRVRHAVTGLCLHGTDSGTVYTRNCVTGNSNQRWEIVSGRFKNLAVRRYLGSDGTSVRTYSTTSALTSWTSSSTVNKYVRHTQSGLCLDSSGADNEHVSLAACRAGQAALWKFEAVV
ncbi:hypothetical protein [Lentzea sp. NPDC051838]|uniref:RICIN domain-containing protein n=1 Tax=Lentzea sp. NPDC051838 TaxID=3154849 RepID=UPI00341A7772